MSRIVANMQKFKAGNMTGLENHVERKTDHHSNKDIDPERSHLNYSVLARPAEGSLKKRVDARIAEGRTAKRAVRSDAVLVNEWVVSSDRKFFENLDAEQTRQFFQDAYSWFADRYGTENIPYATVHMDETTPHMHMGVIPLMAGRLSAKKVFDRHELLYIQRVFPAAMQSRGWDIERGVEGSQHKHLSVEEYKKNAPELEQIKALKEKAAGEIKRLGHDLEEQPLIEQNEIEPETRYKLLEGRQETGRYIVTENALKRVKSNERDVVRGSRLVEEVEKREQSVGEREKAVDEREKAVGDRELRLTLRENEVSDKAGSLETKVFENKLANAEREIGFYREKLGYWQGESEKLRGELGQMTKSYNNLKERFDGLKESLQNIAQAVGMLKYDTGQYLQKLNDAGSRMVDAIRGYASSWLREEQSPERAEQVDKFVKISKGVQNELDQRDPVKQQERQRSRQRNQGWERGM